jgi:hypothetical protein
VLFWKVLADTVAVAHALWLVFIVAGPLAGWFRPRWRRVHLLLTWLTALGWSFYCPLTILEDALRLHYNPGDPYAGKFLERYVREFLSLQIDWRWVTVSVWAWAALWTAVYAWRRRRERLTARTTA